MSKKPGFSVRSLLALTTIAAICFGSLAAPSEVWVPILAMLALFINAYGIQRVVTSPASRPLWLSYFGGAFLTVALVRAYSESEQFDPFMTFIGPAIWHAIRDPFVSAAGGEMGLYQTFAFCLKIVLAIVLPAIPAFFMTFLTHDRDAQSA
jgi:hypothetical protein